MKEHDFNSFCDRLSQKDAAQHAFMHFYKTHLWQPTILLLCIWLAQKRYGKLTTTQLKHLGNSIQPWSNRISIPLWQLNTSAQHKLPTVIAKEIHALFQLSLQCEQKTLFEYLAHTPLQTKLHRSALQDACQSLLAYSKLKPCKLTFTDIDLLKKLLQVSFDTHEKHSINAACDNIISHYYLPQPVTFEQLILDHYV